MKRRVKIAVSSLAFLPMVVMGLAVASYEATVVPEQIAKPVFVVTGFYCFPVFLLLGAIKTLRVSKLVLFAIECAGMLGWSALIACVLWKIVAAIQGEEEPGGLSNNGRFDWARFRVRFVLGFFFGCLVGWRFVKYTHSSTTLLIATFVTGLLCGIIYGFSRPADFWSRGA